MDVQQLHFFKDLSNIAQQRLLEKTQSETYPMGTLITGDDRKLCDALFIVVEGLIRVYRISKQGREATLYDVNAGNVCLKNLSCILKDDNYEAHAVAKENTLIYVIPKDIVLKVLLKEPAFVRFMMESTLNKMETLMTHYEFMSFAPVKTRLRMYVAQASDYYQKRIIYITHAAIASEIGTSREVISRILKTWENEGVITLSRGKIKINSPLD